MTDHGAPTTRDTYLQAAAIARELLTDPAVATAWDAPSALAEFSVRGLAGHLARQVTRVPAVLAAPVPDEQPIGLIDHYGRSSWLGREPSHETNARIRRDGEDEAAGDPAELVAQVDEALAALPGRLWTEAADRVVHLPWGPWSVTLDDFLITRMLEIAVHCDDLAVSVGVPTPPLPDRVLDPVLALLARLSVLRHGAPAVLRAFTRAERAPARIAAI